MNVGIPMSTLNHDFDFINKSILFIVHTLIRLNSMFSWQSKGEGINLVSALARALQARPGFPFSIFNIIIHVFKCLIF